MSAPPGYTGETSLLNGGDSVPIQAQQGGGEESLLKGGDDAIIHPQQGGQVNEIPPNEIFTSDQKQKIIKETALGIATAKALGASEPIIRETARKIALKSYKKIKNESNVLEKSQIIETATPSEGLAAKKATNILTDNSRFYQKYKTPEEQKKVIDDFAITAITEERKKGIKVFNTDTTKSIKLPKYGSASFNTKNQLSKLETYPVHNEFYTLPEPTPGELTGLLASINDRLTTIQKDTDAWLRTMHQTVNKYKEQRKNLWNATLKNTNNKVIQVIPVNNIQQVHQNEIFTQFSRYIHCLPTTVDSIIVIPPIQGKIQKYYDTISRLQAINALTYTKNASTDVFKVKENTILVFMPPFFTNIVEASMNMLMFSLFLDLNKTSPNQVFLLSQSSADNYAMGAFFSQKFGSILENLTMLEPTYIIYPYTRNDLRNGLLISGSTELEKINMPKLHSYTLDDLKSDSNYGKMMNLIFKPSLLENQPDSIPFEEGAQNMFTIRSYTTSDDTKNISTLEKTNISNKACDGLLTEDLNLFRKTNSVYVNTVNISPEAQDLDDITESEIILVVRLNPKGQYTPLCKEESIQSGGGKRFKLSPNAVKAEAHEQLELNGAVYNLRVPEESVREDWLKEIFTKDEAAFLNSLRLTPQILREIFSDETNGNKYIDNLVDFLSTLVSSKCLTDTDLLMKSECTNCRDFLKEVNAYFLKISLDRELIENECVGSKTPSGVLRKKVNERGVKEHSESIMGAKNKFKYLDPYRKVGENSTQIQAEIIGLNNDDGTFKWYTISVPKMENDPEDKMAKREIQAKIEKLKTGYPYMQFIY